MELPLRVCAEGILLPIQGQPGGRRNAIVGWHGERLKVAVTTPPEKGKATREILKLLATVLGLRASQVVLHSGPSNPHKVVLITGVTLDDLQRRLEALTDT